MNECSIDGCHDKHLAKGYCRKHYQRYYRHKDPLMLKQEQHGMHNTLEYTIWARMHHHPSGIIICDRWLHSFKNFYADMGKRPFPKAQLIRIDKDGNYEPGNCKWGTSKEACQNRATTKLNMTKAEEIRKQYQAGNITTIQLSKIYGISRITVSRVLNNKQWIKQEMNNGRKNS